MNTDRISILLVLMALLFGIIIALLCGCSRGYVYEDHHGYRDPRWDIPKVQSVEELRAIVKEKRND